MAAAFTLTDVSLHYSEKQLLSHISITISEGDKIGVVGRNGAGKSTLLRLLAGTEEPDAGDIARKRGLTLAYLPQTPHLRPEDSITQAALSFLPAANEAERESAAYEAQTILSRLGFTDFDQRVGTLSGGQQMRVALAGALCRKADVLLLDEPTNDLDIETLNVLEDYLDSFQGAVIAVSHDRYFLDRVTRKLFALEDGELIPYIGGYADYLADRAAREAAAAPKPEKPAAAPQPAREKAPVKRFSFKEQRDFDTIDGVIAELEGKLSDLAKQIEANSADYEKVMALMAEQEQTQSALDTAMERWMYLQERYEEIQAAKEGKA